MPVFQQDAGIPFSIGSIPIRGRLILAPMDGITAHPFRLICRRLGSAVSYSEFITAQDAIFGRRNIEPHLYFTEEERPFVYQVLDNDPDRLLHAALALEKRKTDWIDVNLGCCAKDVSNRGAGSGLLRDPAKVGQIFTLLTQKLSVPVSAKIRLGWDDSSRNYLQIARILEDSGVSLIAVHGRTRVQGYTGRADWQAIAEVKAAVRIPVLANGDVRSRHDIDEILRHTGCDGVMIGRAALGNPWLFSYRDRSEVSVDEVRAVVLEHYRLLLDHSGPVLGVFRFRRHLVEYLRPYALQEEIIRPLLTQDDSAHVINALEAVFDVLNLKADIQ